MAGKGKVGMPGNSPALAYELRLTELGAQKKPAVKRIQLCFEILDELVPQLGVFQRVVKMIRDEMSFAVYSTELTSSRAQQPEQLPYFVIVQRSAEKRGHQLKQYQEEIESLREQLYTCEAELEKSLSAAEACRHDVRDRDARLLKLSNELRASTSQHECLQKVVSQHQRAQDRFRQEVDYQMFSLQGTIAALNDEKMELAKYKKANDEIQHALSHSWNLSLIHEQTGATELKKLEQHCIVSEVLLQQLLKVQNTLLEEHDAFLNSQVANLANRNAIEEHEKVKLYQESFTDHMLDLLKEMSLLGTHSSKLKEQARAFHTALEQYPEPQQALLASSHPANPLLVQEKVFSKYAALICTSSDGGKNFYPLKEATDCTSCGEKTVICSHKSFTSAVIKLPLNTTHLRISRPLGKIASQTETSRSSIKQNLQSGAEFNYICSYFQAKFPNFQPRKPRRVSIEELVLLVHQFYSDVVREDSAIGKEEEAVPSMMDHFYSWLSRRYLIPDLLPVVAYDIQSALLHHLPSDKDLLVFAHVLCGNVDGAAVRYLWLIADLVELVPWKSVQEFAPWAACLYPSLPEEDIETMAMNFVAQGANKASEHSVMDFFTRMTLKHKEPQIVKVEHVLMDHPCNQPGVMTESEFSEVVESLAPLAPYHLTHRLFAQSLQHSRGKGGNLDAVPIKKLSYIASYLVLQQLLPSITKQIQKTCTLKGKVLSSSHKSDIICSMHYIQSLVPALMQ